MVTEVEKANVKEVKDILKLFKASVMDWPLLKKHVVHVYIL